MCFIGVGLSSHAAPAWVLLAFLGLLIVVWNVLIVTLRQTIIPDSLLGRVNSVYRVFGWGMISVGALVGGVTVTLSELAVGREWALRSPFLLAGLCCLLLLPYLWKRASSAAIKAAPRRS